VINLNKYTVFPNAPITEAVLDIGAELPKETELKSLEILYDSIKKRFPEKQEQRFIKTGIKLIKGETSPALDTSSGMRGYLFRSQKENKVTQSRLDGFTFNKLKPYENWDIFRSEARELWNLYCKIANPVKVVRIALRYINRIEVPLPIRDFSDYILTNPEIAPDLPQEIDNFFMRLVIQNHKIKSTAIITETMGALTPSKKLPLILDIDVFRENEYIGNTNEMWEDFERLRNFKNDIFFNSITDKAKELFK